jgi:hypothetical protein
VHDVATARVVAWHADLHGLARELGALRPHEEVVPDVQTVASVLSLRTGVTP